MLASGGAAIYMPRSIEQKKLQKRNNYDDDDDSFEPSNDDSDESNVQNELNNLKSVWSQEPIVDNYSYNVDVVSPDEQQNDDINTSGNKRNASITLARESKLARHAKLHNRVVDAFSGLSTEQLNSASSSTMSSKSKNVVDATMQADAFQVIDDEADSDD